MLLEGLAAHLETRGTVDVHADMIHQWLKGGAPTLDTPHAIQSALAPLGIEAPLADVLSTVELQDLRPPEKDAVMLPVTNAVSAYLGRVYPGRNETEVISTGLEPFWDEGSGMLELAIKDADHLALMLGLLHS